MFRTIKKSLMLAKDDASLSVVFFVDRGRTRRKILSFRGIFISTFLLGSLLITGTLAMVIVQYLFAKNIVLARELTDRKVQLVGFQSQYEDMFEAAYQMVEAREAGSDRVSPIDDDKTKNWQPNIYSDLMYISDLRIRPLDRGGVRVYFSMVNASGILLEGYTWLIARTRDGDSMRYRAAPEPDMIFSKDGAILDLTLAKNFRFRSQYNSQFDLSLEESLQIDYLSLYVSDLEGGLRVRQTFQPLRKSSSQLSSH